MPFAIIVAIGAERLWRMTSHQTSLSRILRNALAFVLGIAVCDHLLNVYGSYRTVDAINSGSLAMADWFQKHVPAGSIVIGNALHIEDIRLFSGGHIVPYWTVDTGIVELKRAVETPEKLRALLKQNQNHRDVYFLDVNYNFTPDKVYYHSHKYVRNESVVMKAIGVVHTTRTKYPYLDPLRALTPRPYILFLGGGDLENDFYRGPAQDGTPFMWEIYAEYHVYQVTGTEVAPWDPNIPWSFVEEGYQGFNLFKYGDRYLAFAQALGPIDLHWLNTRVVNDYQNRNALVVGSSLEEVKRVLNQLPTPRGLLSAGTPSLLEEGYRGFNLIGYDKRIYAIPQAEGAFEIERIKRNEYGQWFSATSLDEVKRLVDQSIAEERSQSGRSLPNREDRNRKIAQIAARFA
jgi:hypothetical protein